MSPVMTTRIALKALARNKMRTALTMLGMIIGVSAVITLVALGSGAQAQIEEQIKAGGTNMVTIMAGNFTMGGVRGGVRRGVEPEDRKTSRRSGRKCPTCSTSRPASICARRSSPAIRTGRRASKAPTSTFRSSGSGR